MNKKALSDRHGLDGGDARTEGDRRWSKLVAAAMLSSRPEPSHSGSVGNAALSYVLHVRVTVDGGWAWRGRSLGVLSRLFRAPCHYSSVVFWAAADCRPALS